MELCIKLISCAGLASSTTQLTQLSEDILSNHCRLAQNLSAENLDEILTYTVNRLLKDYPIAKRIADSTPPSTGHAIESDAVCASDGNSQSTSSLNNNSQIDMNVAGGKNSSAFYIPAIHLKVFYQVTAAPSVELLLNALYDFRLKCQETANIVYTVLPACSLHNFSTFLSICGVRHE